MTEAIAVSTHGLYCRFALCLALTLLTEGLLIFIIRRKTDWVKYSVLCNIVTNPAVNLILSLAVSFAALSKGGLYMLTAMLEAAAVAAEGLMYRGLCEVGLKRAMLLSLILNAASFTLGMLIL